jgi:hypothetical protein
MDATQIFKKYLPPLAVDYCHSLWQEYRFKFVIAPKRQTKLGDYRFVHEKNHHIVTVNGNLNPYSFLTTYIHEVAHLTTFKKYGNKVLPHGKEWKNEFHRLFIPLLHESFLPKEVLSTLKTYLKNPRASSCSEQGLFELDPKEDLLQPNEAYLKSLPQGTKFTLKKRVFTKLELRRTRILCQESASGRKFLIHQNAIVKIVPVT